MKTFTVSWVIDVEADTPEDAAKLALSIMQDKDSTAQFFSVQDVESKQVVDVDFCPF